MSTSNNPGDVNINQVMLEGSDFINNFVSMTFYEHILSPIMKGMVRVNQYTGAQSKFSGNTNSTISFGTPSGQTRTYVLSTNGIKGVEPNDDAQRSRNFTVDLVSPHALVNNATPNYQKSFKNKQLSTVVQSILSDGLGLKIPLNIDETKGLHGSDYLSYILTQKSPLAHIEDLRRLAISSQNTDGFLMFSGIGSSGAEEFFFKTIYNLIQESPIATITNKTKFELNSAFGSSMFNNVIEQWLNQQTDALSKGSSFSSGTTMFDVNKATAKISQVPVGPQRQQTISSTSLNPGKVSGFVTSPHNGMAATSHVILEDSRRPLSNKAPVSPFTAALMADMSQNYLTIKIPGNTNLNIGQVVNYDYRENTDMFMNNDTKFYGKHLIAGITHYIGPITDQPRHVTYLDLVNIQTNNGTIT